MHSISKPISCVALLRGINVGGNTKVSMTRLKDMFETMGYSNVKTILNSGNVLFDTTATRPETLRQNIETQFIKTFGFPVIFIIRTKAQIQTLVASDPFADIRVTPNTRLYVTFLSEKPLRSLTIPYQSPEFGFRILGISDNQIFSVLTFSPNQKTPEFMTFLEKEFGKNITTRNWNTIIRIGKNN